MGFFKSLKGDHPDRIGQSHPNLQNDPDNRLEEYAPPPGPPPTHQTQRLQTQYTPPLGPPPGREQYIPPPGPLPSHRTGEGTISSSSSFPPQDHTEAEPPPYHDWTVVPDNALLPPPPSIGHDRSPSSNADLSDADYAHSWCNSHPLIRPHQPTHSQHTAVANGDLQLVKPQEYKGDLFMASTGVWKGSTQYKSKDSCLLSSYPLYFAAVDAPLGVVKTIYYEVKVHSFGRGQGINESSIALGYCAVPYPTWRMPGWERGSLAVHSDDGRRYINDTWGGKDFTSPFQVGDTLGLGMCFSVSNNPPEYGTPQQHGFKVEVFFTRNGEKRESWDLHEELDASKDLGVDGLDGRFDLYAAVGVFGGVEFDVSFRREGWLWRPR